MRGAPRSRQGLVILVWVVRSAPGHQETPKPPSGGFLFGLVNYCIN